MGPKSANRHGWPTAPKRPYAERQGALMTAEEAADKLAVTPSMVQTLARNGEIRRVKINGYLNRYTVASIDAYLARLTGEGQ